MEHVVRALGRVSPDLSAIEDAVHEAFMALTTFASQNGQFKNDCVRPWLFVVATHALSRERPLGLRGLPRERRHDVAGVFDEATADAKAANDLLYAELSSDLSAAWKQLDQKDQQVIQFAIWYLRRARVRARPPMPSEWSIAASGFASTAPVPGSADCCATTRGRTHDGASWIGRAAVE